MLKLHYLGYQYKEPTHLKRPSCWERLKARGEGGDRGWVCWMASPTQWTWVWSNSRTVNDREARCAAVHGVAKIQTLFNDWTTPTTKAKYAHLLSPSNSISKYISTRNICISTQNTWMKMLITALTITAPNRKQSKCKSAVEWENKWWCTQTMEYCTEMKIDKNCYACFLEGKLQ